MEIPKIQFNKPKLNKKFKISLFLAIVIVIFILAFAGLYLVSSFFDSNKLIFQKPIFVKTQSPIIVEKRFALSPIPKATYVEVSPLTSPNDIVEAAKHGTIPQYADMGTIKPVSKDIIRTLVHNKVVQKYGESVWNEMDYIIEHESGYDPYIVNKTSGACGIFQALPCSKLNSLDIIDQIYWGLNKYIPEHYNGSIDAAYTQKKTAGWY